MSKTGTAKNMEASSMPDWDTLLHGDMLQREDIYRQRIFGNNSGSFIDVEERNKISSTWLVLFLFFVAVTWMYTFDRLDIGDEYLVYEAIRRPFETTVFRSQPQPLVFEDIDSMQDVQDWLLNAFPDIMTPDVQHFNIPLGQIRFSMRRMKMEKNVDLRFNNYHPLLWLDKDGISPEETSAANDDPDSFGVYRVWANVSLDWSDPLSKGDKKCPSDSTWIDMVDFSNSKDTTDASQLDNNCRQWCEQLIRPLTCHCFERSDADGRCNFYQVPTISLVHKTDPTAELLARDASVLIPVLEPAPMEGLYAMYPVMKQFEFQNKQLGYKDSPGFVQFLSYYFQEELLSMAKLRKITPSPPQRVMSSEIEDWIAGGYIGKDTVTVSVDFATYNPNYEMFSWVQILFENTASGYVRKSIKISSDKLIKSKELADTWAIGNEFDTVWEIAYICLVLFYVGCEIWRMSCCAMGPKYFASGWTWLTLIHLLFNLVTIACFLGYKGQTDFIKELTAMQGETIPTFKTQNLISFSAQVSKYATFKIAAAFNLLFLACQLLQYLHDIYPRVTVLVETVSDSFVPIFYFTLVCLVLFYGVIMWLHIWFGRKIADFNSLRSSVVTVVSMTVGEFSSFNAVRDAFGYATFGFYIPYQLFMIVIILNFPRAVLNAGYADASLKHQDLQKHEKKLRAAKETTGETSAWRIWKGMKMKWNTIRPEELRVKALKQQVKQHESVRIKNKRANLCFFCIFVILYTFVCTMIISTNNSYSMTKMVEHAIKVPTFSKFSPITGQAIRGSNFNSINSRKDVSKFLQEVLPTAMFFTSAGTFDGKDNMLLNYSSAPQFRQLVLSNWNIMVGQKPVRMTAKLSKMKLLGGEAIKGVVSPDLWVREAVEPSSQSVVSEVYGLPDGQFKSETLLSGVNDTKTRNLLDKYCNYSFGYGASSYTELNGFVCMLDVNESSTVAQLAEMADGGFINAQMEALSIEFLLYNAWAKTFAYVAIRFGFQPSGIIWKDVEVEPVSLELLSGVQGVVLLILMCIMMIMNFYYLFANIWELLKALAVGYRETAQKRWGNKIAAMLREFVYFFLLDWFNLLDMVSCISTLVVMIMFFQYTSSPLSSYYYFQEEPIWVQAKCDSRNFAWCSDQEVLTQFSIAKEQFRLFTRVSALNTVFIYMRALRYLKEFKHMKVIFTTLIRGLEDILWFVVIFFTGQFGYMLMGHIVFGGTAMDFSTKSNAMQACLDIFLGTFDSRAMAEASLAIMIFYVLTYWFVFKLIFVNMFLAIIDKNYGELDKERGKQEAEKQDAPDIKEPSVVGKLMAQVKGLFKKGSNDKSEDAPVALTTPQNATATGPTSAADGEAAAGTLAMGATMTQGSQGSGGSSNPKSAAAEETSTPQEDFDRAGLGEFHAEVQEVAPVFTKEQVTNQNWKLLPEDVRDWSLEKANEVNTFLHDLLLTRHSSQGDQNEASLKESLENAETKIGERRSLWAHEAHIEKSRLDSQELAELRKVHQDQESLSWYIMKRDAELKKLESAKELKKDRFDKMVKAANSLIKRDEDVQAGDQLSIANR